MPFCRNCGKQLGDREAYCPKCGQPVVFESRPQQRIDPSDSGSIGWAILGFLIPLVGLILFIVWSDSRPQSAKMSGIGALIGFIFSIVLPIILIAVLVGMGAISGMNA